jgi:hypothetical protein
MFPALSKHQMAPLCHFSLSRLALLSTHPPPIKIQKPPTITTMNKKRRVTKNTSNDQRFLLFQNQYTSHYASFLSAFLPLYSTSPHISEVIYIVYHGKKRRATKHCDVQRMNILSSRSLLYFTLLTQHIYLIQSHSKFSLVKSCFA